MTDKVMEFRKRYSEIKNRGELLELEGDIGKYLASEDFKTLPVDEKDHLEDLLVDVINKKEHFQSGCDPWRIITKSREY
jgi:hypothetical protein